MNQVQKWGWDISWLESVPSVHLKWCQTSEQSELINANKDHIFIIISDSQKWRKIVLASDWPRTRIDQNSKSLQILSLDLFLFSGTQRTQIYSINSLELITWYQKTITCHRHQFRVDRPSKFWSKLSRKLFDFSENSNYFKNWTILTRKRVNT